MKRMFLNVERTVVEIEIKLEKKNSSKKKRDF